MGSITIMCPECGDFQKIETENNSNDPIFSKCFLCKLKEVKIGVAFENDLEMRRRLVFGELFKYDSIDEVPSDIRASCQKHGIDFETPLSHEDCFVNNRVSLIKFSIRYLQKYRWGLDFD